MLDTGISPQRSMGRNPRIDLYLDLAQLISGFLLVGFLWTHMVFVATIIIGADTFNSLAQFLDDYYLSYVGIPFIGLVALIHVIVVVRRIPNRYQDYWRHARTIMHFDTWTWIFQVVTALGIAILASIHVFAVIMGWPIDADTSAARMHAFWWFYLVLLILGEYHAGFGIYRQFVKWGWIKRKTIGFALKSITVIIVALGLAALWVFVQLGGALR
ncbi:MAG: succinate dehydrogenase [Eubacteriales bacterium]|nr:succinate dehydrogenase [Clostridia bacterium]MDZ4042151.1 succinate dehydrogenase [Eubacteriales bacterium]MDZ7609825.1 succinate dehydrogenase [Eubacteriales bacterium]